VNARARAAAFLIGGLFGAFATAVAATVDGVDVPPVVAERSGATPSSDTRRPHSSLPAGAATHFASPHASANPGAKQRRSGRSASTGSAGSALAAGGTGKLPSRRSAAPTDGTRGGVTGAIGVLGATTSAPVHRPGAGIAVPGTDRSTATTGAGAVGPVALRAAAAPRSASPPQAAAAVRLVARTPGSVALPPSPARGLGGPATAAGDRTRLRGHH